MAFNPVTVHIGRFGVAIDEDDYNAKMGVELTMYENLKELTPSFI